MTADDSTHVTRILGRMHSGDDAVAAELFPLVYHELRAIAGRFMQAERVDHTLQPTALVHEAFVRLVRADDLPCESRLHFIGVASRAMRQVLINYARARGAVKRGGPNRAMVTLGDASPKAENRVVDVLALEEALERLANLSERQARLVELRFFGGLTMEEAAEALGIGLTTAKSEWAIARAWLSRELADHGKE